MNFLRNLLAAILGCLVAFGICFVMFLVFISLASVEQTTSLKKNSVLEIQLEYPLSEYTGNDGRDPFAGLFEQTLGLDEILHAIAVAKDDEDIAGISINSNYMIGGWAQVRAIREALKDFGDGGKFVYSYGDYYLQKDYFLSSVADSVFLNPVGAMDFNGLSAEVLYFKELQEKTGVKMEVVRHGKYKSAVEPFLANEMSEANRMQLQELIGSLWGSLLNDIAEGRGMQVDDLRQIADTLGGRRPEFALQNGLVDGLMYFDQYEALLKKASGIDADEDQPYVQMSEYMESARKKKLKKGDGKIALLFAQGEIFYGEGGPNVIGQGIFMEALADIREDDDIKAVVLRIDSPGGSALTSEIIWREIMLTRESKPVVVSLGNMAASGGYYIAVAGERIWAEPTTITGSIGVFGTIPNISELADKWGINAEQVRTNPHGPAYSFFEPMTEEFRDYVEEGIEATYDTFLARVAEGRNMSIEEVDDLAQGRVWSGADAERIGLVDALGGMEEAIEEAAELAGLEEYGLKKFPRYKSGFARLLEDLGGAENSRAQSILEDQLGGELSQIFVELRQMLRQKGIQARIPFNLHIK